MISIILSDLFGKSRYKIVTQENQYGEFRYGVKRKDFSGWEFQALPNPKAKNRDVDQFVRWVETEEECKKFIDEQIRLEKLREERLKKLPVWKTTNKSRYP